MKGTGSGKKGRKQVYRHPAGPAEIWQGRIERIAWGGRGLARAEDGRLLLLSAPLALFAGEAVEAEVHWKARHGEGTVRSWIAPAPERCPPGCAVAERCGGCDLQGAGDHAAALKLAMVDDLLHRQLPSAPTREWHPAPAGTLRHRIQLHWDGKRIGFHRRGSHEIVEVRACPAAEPSLSAAIPRLLDALEAQVLPPRPQRWQLATGTPPGEVWASDEKARAWRLEPDGWKRSEEPVAHDFGPHRLRHPADGFFQVCAPWALRAFAAVLDSWDVRGELLYDLYGGVGLFSRLLKGRFRSHVLVESAADSVAWARRNLEDLAVEFHCADVADWLPQGLGNREDLLLLDPPRAGLGLDLCARLQEAGAGRMLLVGCDGAAFCRDVNALAPAWRLARLAVLDLFPLTVHAEFVGLLQRA